MAIQKGVPVVPVIVNGSQQVLPAKGWRIHSGEIEVVLSPPLAVEEYAGKKQGREELMDKVRQAISAHLRPSSSLPTDKEFSLSPRAL